MIAIVPILISDQKEFWKRAECKEAMQRFLGVTAKASEIELRYIGSDDPEILQLAQELSFKPVRIHQCVYEEQSLLPPGTREVLAAVEHNTSCDVTDVMVLDYRNALISTQRINQAALDYRKNSSTLLITVRKTIDNPCQLKTAYKVLDTGFIPFREEADIRTILSPASLANLQSLQNQGLWSANPCLTLSFPFDWSSHHISDNASDLYVKNFDNWEIRYVPATEEALIDLPAHPPLWVYVNADRARVLWEYADFLKDFALSDKQGNSQLIGTKDFEDFSAILTRDNKSREYALTLNHELFSGENYVLKISLLFQEGFIGEDVLEWERPDLINSFSFILPKEEQTIGIIYCLCEIAENGSLDLLDPFETVSPLWTYDPATGQAINGATGSPIAGRQDFPNVFEPDGTICITNKEQLLGNHEALFCQEGIDFLLLPHNESMQIKSEFDLLKYRVFKRAHQL